MWWNDLRSYQADVIIDTHMRKDRTSIHTSVLRVLAAAMANQTIEGRLTVKDTTFLSLKTLARRSHCSESSVRRAIQDLINDGFLTKSHIQGRKLRGRPGKTDEAGHNGQFDNCRYHLVTKVWDAIPVPWKEAQKAREAKAKQIAVEPSKPISAAEQATLDAIAEAPASKLPVPTGTPAPKPNADAEEWREVFEWMRENFPDHPSMQEKNADKMMKPIIYGLIQQAGNAKLVVMTLDSLDQDTVDYLNRAERLGGVIRAGFEHWLNTFVDSTATRLLDEYLSRQWQGLNMPPESGPILDRLGSSLAKKLEDDLWFFENRGFKDGFYDVVIGVSDEYAQKHGLAMVRKGNRKTRQHLK